MLAQLLEKLQSENRRSNYLNSLPGKSLKKFDIAQIDDVIDNFSSTFVEKLLTKKKFKQNISFPSTQDDEIIAKSANINRRLKKLHLEAQDQKKEKDFDVIYFGFPLVVKTDPNEVSKTIIAPLFLWRLNLIHSKNYSEWIIERTENCEIKENHALEIYFEAELGRKFPSFDIEDNFVELIDQKTFNDYKKEIENSLKINNCQFDLNTILNSGIQKSPSTKSDFTHDVSSEFNILPCGTLGVFKASKEGIILDLKSYIKSKKTSLSNSAVKIYDYSANDLDPSQIKILESSSMNQNLVIHGPPGTGKSQVLTGYIVSALAKRKKMLVVCEKQTALDIIKNNLTELSLDKNSAIVTDVIKDRKKVISQARSLNELAQIIPESKILDRYIEDQEKNNDSYTKHLSAKSKKYFDTHNWTNTIGLYINLKKKHPSFEKLSLDCLSKLHSIPTDGFEEKINLLEKKYNHVGKDIISHYNNTIDLKLYDAPIESFDNHISIIQDYFENFKLLTTKKISSIANNLESELVKFEEFVAEVNTVINELEKFNLDSLNNYLKSGFILRFLKCKFSNTHKKIDNQFKFLTEIILRNKDKEIAKINFKEHNDLSSFKILLTNKLNIIRDDIQLTKDINHHNELIKKYDQKFEKLKSQNFKNLKNQIIKPNIYSDEIFVKLNDYDESVLHQIKKCQEYEGYILDYFEFKNELNELGIAMNSDNWHKIISCNSWVEYLKLNLLEHIVNQNKKNDVFRDNQVLEKAETTLFNIKKSVVERANQVVNNNMFKAISHFNSNTNYSFNQLFNIRGAKGRKRTPLKKIIEEQEDLFLSLFPVLLVTPEVASTLFKGKNKLFDVVILDEASQINIEDAYSSILKGKKIIIAGDEHQMPPTNLFRKIKEIELDENNSSFEDEMNLVLADSESLLDFAVNNNKFKSTYLDFHYRSRHHKLIDFSNKAFYSRLIPVPNKFDYNPIKFIKADGIYDNRTNEKEAEKIVEILFNIEKSGTKYPSIGIATFNLPQRNLIFEKLSDLASENLSFASKLTELEESGLFIKNLENLQGDERDVIIISTTFGETSSGQFRRNFGPVQTRVGHRLLNVLITRAKEKIFVVSSIPNREIDNFADYINTQGNRGKAIFYAYLFYARAVSNDETPSIQRVLNVISKSNDKSDNLSEDFKPESPFEEEVLEELLSNFSRNEITTQEKDSGFRIDIVIRPDDQPNLKIAIECDGATYHSNYDSYLYDLHRQNILERAGYKFIRIWSKKWFANTKLETKKLLKKVIEFKYENNANDKMPNYLIAEKATKSEKIDS